MKIKLNIEMASDVDNDVVTDAIEDLFDRLDDIYKRAHIESTIEETFTNGIKEEKMIVDVHVDIPGNIDKKRVQVEITRFAKQIRKLDENAVISANVKSSTITTSFF